MLAGLVFISVALICALLGTITDLKIREVPNWVSYFLIMFGLGGHLILSLINKSAWPIIYSLIGAGAFYGFSAVMFYAGQWGGGDVKLLTGFGATLPMLPQLITSKLPIVQAPWPFLLTLWLNILLIGTLFGLLGSMKLALKHKKSFVKHTRELLKNWRFIVYLLFGFILIILILIFVKPQISILASIAWAIITILFYLFIFIKSVEDVCMYRYIKPRELTEGDWVAEEVKIKNHVVYSPEKTGISSEDINKLCKFEKEGKLSKIKIKEGLPFVPSFFVGLIISIIYGDIIFIVLKSVFL